MQMGGRMKAALRVSWCLLCVGMWVFECVSVLCVELIARCSRVSRIKRPDYLKKEQKRDLLVATGAPGSCDQWEEIPLWVQGGRRHREG